MKDAILMLGPIWTTPPLSSRPMVSDIQIEIDGLKEKQAWTGQKDISDQELQRLVEFFKARNITRTASWYHLKSHGFSIDAERMKRVWNAK